jgi:outer membrane protein assembly factor BamD (BamD/ComL family)
VAFSLAVSDHNWREALEVGRQIVEEFPNSRMAHEVTERMQVLTKRAQESGAAVPAAAAQA